MGFGLDENVCTAYNFICNNYADGDDILLFGFSRGAYTARALAGLVIDVGIIPPGEMTKFPEMYGEYKKRQDCAVFQLSDWFQENGHIVLYQDVKTSFVGVWDTIGALGIPESGFSSMTGWNKGYQFWDTQLHPSMTTLPSTLLWIWEYPNGEISGNRHRKGSSCSRSRRIPRTFHPNPLVPQTSRRPRLEC